MTPQQQQHSDRRSRPLALIACLLVSSLVGCASSEGVTRPDLLVDEQAPDPIEAEQIQDHVDVLSSDSFEGRGAATRGERRAAKYIVAVLKGIDGIVPGGPAGSWFQEFAVPASVVMGEVDFGVARNVLALLPGSDPSLAEEVIVLGAHYDHVGPRGLHGGSLGGMGQIHNGADDNASGTSLLLEVAAALASGERPRRTIMFQWYSAEELGLLGSRHWVDEPTLPLERVVAMINCDMVGRMQGSTLLIGGTGSSPQLERLVEDARGFLGIDFVLDPPGNAPSDNSSFYNKDIPALFLFSGVHGDYHRPTDDADKLNAPGTERVARLARRLIRGVDRGAEAPSFRSAPGMAKYWTPAVYYGLTFDPSEDGAARLAVLTPDSPAGRARDSQGRSLAEGDVLLRVDGQVPRSMGDLERSLRVTDDDRTARTFEFLRNDEQLLSVRIRPEIR